MSIAKQINNVISYYFTIIFKFIFAQKENNKLFLAINNFINKKIFGGNFVNYSFKFLITNTYILIKNLIKNRGEF